MNHTITVFGLGFVGLTTALGFAAKGNKVFGFDVDRKRSNMIQSGKIPFAEPGLDEALNNNLHQNFIIADKPVECAKKSDFIFICVGTPNKKSGGADFSYIDSVLESIIPILDDGKYRVVVIKSTIPPSTTKEYVIPSLESRGLHPGTDFGVANNPEFLREGKCWDDFINADRIVCGVGDRKSAENLRSLYSNFDAPIFAVSLNTGEFIKYLSNSLLATMISFSNEMSIIADTIGDIQVKNAFEILHKDRRWESGNMSSYVYPGCGYGGYCLPKDTRALYYASSAKGYSPEILHNVILTNEKMPHFAVKKIERVSQPTEKIGILGLSFKPESDDVRDSASAKIIDLLQKDGYNFLAAYDPVANKLFDQKYKFHGIKYCDSIEEISSESNVLVIVTAWNEFKSIPGKNKNKQIIDCRYFI